jgi:Holliday junction DNA helicase RuvA
MTIMIGRLTGIILTSHQSPLIIDVTGVGYSVHVTQHEARSLKYNKQATLHIHTHVKEDALDLYGFSDQNDLSLFELLLTVSGIGPKTGLSIIDRGAEAVERAVIDADTEFFTTIPRLGKKNAQKIIIELKNKLGGLRDIDLTGQTEGETKQIFEALTAMGFQRQEIVGVLPHLKNSATLGEKVRSALKLLGRPK